MARRLLAIVVADVVGYSRLMNLDEEDTHARLSHLRQTIFEPVIAAHQGRFVKSTGDGYLATFDDADRAVRCSIDILRSVAQANLAEAATRKIHLRFGVNMAEVIAEADDVFGDGVNIASRLQTYAEPDSLVVSGEIAQRLAPLEGVRVSDLGDLPLKSIARPVPAVSLRLVDERRHILGDARPGSESRPSIAILPFEEQAAAPSEAYFAAGIVDDIIHCLSGLKELFVLSRGSSLGLQAGVMDVRQIGRELDVRYVLHGKIHRSRSQNRIRIGTELDDAGTGLVVASDRWEGEIGDLFELQANIAQRVVGSLAPQIRDRERLRAMRKHPQNMTAYDFLLQALDPLFRMDYASFSLAKGLLQRAITSDPDYGPAYSYAAYWHLLRVGQGWSKDPAADTAEASRMALSAIERDETDALALAINGHVHSYLKKDYETAVELQDRALEYGPSCALAWTLSSVTQGYLGNGEAAVERARHGLRLSPRGAHVVFYEHILSQAHYISGAYDEAVKWALSAHRHNGLLTSNIRCLIASLVAAGRLEDARQHAHGLLQLDPGFRLTRFAAQTPLSGDIRDRFVERLGLAGLPP